jgi:hypothetical protein
MKKSILGVMSLLAGACVVHGQGSVAFANYGSPIANYIYVSFKMTPTSTATLLGGASGPAPTMTDYAQETGNGADWTVQLYGAVGSSLPASSLAPLAGITATLETGSSADATPGTWSSTAIATFPSAPNGTTATVSVYAWYNDGGMITSYSAAVTDLVPVGSDSPVNVTLGAPPAPASFLPAMGNVTAIAPVPEPSTIALGIVGASTFLMRLRRKQ